MNGKEYFSKNLEDLFVDKRIGHQSSYSEASKQNGAAEQKNIDISSLLGMFSK